MDDSMYIHHPPSFQFVLGPSLGALGAEERKAVRSEMTRRRGREKILRHRKEMMIKLEKLLKVSSSLPQDAKTCIRDCFITAVDGVNIPHPFIIANASIPSGAERESSMVSVQDAPSWSPTPWNRSTTCLSCENNHLGANTHGPMPGIYCVCGWGTAGEAIPPMLYPAPRSLYNSFLLNHCMEDQPVYFLPYS
jgi:hypothetical protein